MAWWRCQPDSAWIRTTLLVAAVIVIADSNPASGHGYHAPASLRCAGQFDQNSSPPSDRPVANLNQGQEGSVDSCELESRNDFRTKFLSPSVEDAPAGNPRMSASVAYFIFVERPDHLITLPGTPPPASTLG